MASVKGGIVKSEEKTVAASTEYTLQTAPLGVLLHSPNIQKRFNDMLGKKAAGFLSSLLSLVNNNKQFAKVKPLSIVSAAATAASLDLPVNQSLGAAWIVPYGENAQFQIGYKGYIQLAQRSGLMKSITMEPVYEGEIENWDRFTESFTPGEAKSNVVVGYFCRFELVNGFAKAEYWDKQKVIDHALKFNPMCKSAGKLSGSWKEHFDGMACKTVLSHLLRTYAPLSIEMSNALSADGTTFDEKGEAAENVETVQGDVTDATPMEVEEVPEDEKVNAEILAAMDEK